MLARTGLPVSRLILLAVLMLPVSVPAAAGIDEAVEFYESGNYSRAADILEQTLSANPSSRAYHWLAKSYGHLAEQARPFRAMALARKTRQALERAVELDSHNRAALEDLIEFYRQAPALVGGNPQRAAELRRKLTALDQDTPIGSHDWPHSNNDS